ncbi:MAG: LysR family transcriptional regulator [Alphaproteobacteria bacterium]|nr:LysR family transcriptional regulator [Alphaproteobacteria bacterium]
MTLEQLRIFVFVAERAHMTKAAQALGLTQSAVSAAVAALEARYQVRLFDRVGRGLVLTEAGRTFLTEATAVLLRARAAEQALTDLAGLKRGVLHVAASQTVSTYWLPRRLARFATVHPGLDIAMLTGNSAETAQAVVEGRAELGFIEGGDDHPALLRQGLAEDRIGLYAAPSHPLVGRAVSLSALQAARWVLREPGSGTRAHFERGLAERGVQIQALSVGLELPSNEAVLSAAEEGGWIAAVSELAAASLVAAGRLTRLAFDLPPRHFDLVTHKERRLSAAGRAFVEAVTASP